MPSPNHLVLCCPLPYRVAPVFVQVVYSCNIDNVTDVFLRSDRSKLIIVLLEVKDYPLGGVYIRMSEDCSTMFLPTVNMFAMRHLSVGV